MHTKNERSTPQKASLLIVEQGVDWTGWAERIQRAHRALTLVAQLPHECASCLTRRIQQHICAMIACAERLDEVLLVGSGGSDEVVVERWRTVRALLPAIRPSAGARLRLAAATRDRRGLHAMETFSQMLGDELRGSGVLVIFEHPAVQQGQRRALKLTTTPHPRRASTELTAE